MTVQILLSTFNRERMLRSLLEAGQMVPLSTLAKENEDERIRTA